MKITFTFAVAWLTAAIVGCSAAVDVVPPCDVNASEHAAVEQSVRHLEAFKGRWRFVVTRACVGIHDALTGEVIPIDRPLSQQSAETICKAAKDTIEKRLDDGAELGAAVSDVGACYAYDAAADACLANCGPTLLCADACLAAGIFQGGCRTPTMRVESTDPGLRTAIQDHFAAILALDLFVAKDGSDGVDHLDAALAEARASVANEPACALERAAVDRWTADADLAFDELIELLDWVRISRLEELESP